MGLKNIEKIIHMRVSRGPWTLACPYHENVRGHVVRNFSGTEVLVGKMVGFIPKGPNADVGCMYGVFLLAQLP